jgi:hypothetical protein
MVIIVGLPFPNMGSPELMERLRYADRLIGHIPAGDSSRLGPAGRELYDNICMNSVNQSIGTHHCAYTCIILANPEQAAQYAMRMTGPPLF